MTWLLSLPGSSSTVLAFPHKCSDAWELLLIENNCIFNGHVKSCISMASRASPKYVFHNDGPRTVPWKTWFSRSMTCELLPPTTTFAFRFLSHDCKALTMSSMNPLILSLPTSLVASTLSKAPDTSEQYKPNLRPLHIPCNQVSIMVKACNKLCSKIDGRGARATGMGLKMCNCLSSESSFQAVTKPCSKPCDKIDGRGAQATGRGLKVCDCLLTGTQCKDSIEEFSEGIQRRDSMKGFKEGIQ